MAAKKLIAVDECLRKFLGLDLGFEFTAAVAVN